MWRTKIINKLIEVDKQIWHYQVRKHYFIGILIKSTEYTSDSQDEINSHYNTNKNPVTLVTGFKPNKE